MTYTIPMDNTVVAEGGSRGPLPEGKYLATIMPTKKNGTAIEKRPYAKEGANARLTALGIRFEIAKGQAGAGKNVFADIALARKFAAKGTGKYPDGAPNFLFFGLFRSLGYDVDQPDGFTLPEDSAIMGEQVELVLVISDTRVDKDSNAQNEVRFINKANGIPVNVARVNERAQEAWSPSGPPQAATPPTQQPTQAWTPDAADIAAAQATPPTQAWTPDAEAKGF